MKKHLPALILLTISLFSHNLLYATHNSDRFHFFTSLNLGWGFPAGESLSTEEKLLEANREELAGFNYHHSFQFNLRGDSIIRIAESQNKNYAVGVRGLIGYYDIIHKAKFNYNKSSRTSSGTQKETFLYFWHWMAGPVLYISFDKKEGTNTNTGYHTLFALYGKIFHGNLESLPFGQNRPEFKTKISGRKLNIGYGITGFEGNYYMNAYIAYSKIWLKLEKLPESYSDEGIEKVTTIGDLFIGIGFGIGFGL